MQGRLGMAWRGVLLGAALAWAWPVSPAAACDEPGVTCSSEELPPAALAPGDTTGSGASGEAQPSTAPRSRPGLLPLNPNGYNQGGEQDADLADVLRQIQRERAEAKAEAHR